MVFSTSLAGGGWHEGPLYLYINGARAENGWDWPLLEELGPGNIGFNSADIDGNGLVDLADVGLFASDYYNEYHYRSDFSCDGILNLSDVGRMAMGIGSACQ